MLANGAKLGYKKHGAAESAYTDLPGLKEIPENRRSAGNDL